MLREMPEDLRERAFDLRTQGVAEFAFPIEDVLRVISTIEEHHWTLLGGDVWRRTVDGAKPTGDSWFADQRPGETEEGFRTRAIGALRDFVKHYRVGEGLMLTYVLR